ncbi:MULTISPECIES: hypothetical protein [Paenibacillus]|uniref:Uncharacterized protein n=1 Tax=Paenibacillus odorifer TaxID=189426 RepID=A0AB36J5L7_9BACL|nr:hypothetical protein [Paenibacillus odorifer]OME10536.1 hypothetical protein BSK47_30495 [Paenibacillus odorifer]
MTEKPELKKEPTELEELVKEKVKLAKRLGLMEQGTQPIEGYKETNDYKRIQEIDLKLWELIK